MRVLVTGLTSFTGRHLLPLIEEAGWEIFPLVRKPMGLKNEIVWDFISSLPSALPACEAVVHLAADINFLKELNLDLYRVNTLSTAKLVAYAQRINAYFIFASSIAIHGACKKVGKTSPVATDNHYGASKYMAEEIIRTFLKGYAILRISGIYGLNGPSHMGLNKSISEAAQACVVPTLKGAGHARRNYICVLDVAKWIFYLLKEYSMKRGDCSQGIYYLADSKVMSIREYLETIVRVFNPQENVKMLEGVDGADAVVLGSPAPFELIKFEDYLNLIKRSVHGVA